MSAKQTGMVWELDLPHNEAWVLMAMADHADHEGRNVYPGVPLLAWKTGYTTRQIRRILARLQNRGLIVVEQPGGGRRTTRYRLELARGQRRDPYRHPGQADRPADPEPAEPREDTMSPLVAEGSEASMSAQPGHPVTAPRTRLRPPNRQGRETLEPSPPPPSDRPRSVDNRIGRPSATQNGAEGGRPWKRPREMDDEWFPPETSLSEAMRAICAGWPGRAQLAPDPRARFDRQAARLARGEDVEAWTHAQSGQVVPPRDRPRVMALGLGYLGDGTSRTLRGGVMYAVAKHFRSPPAVDGTEHARVAALGAIGEEPGRSRARSKPFPAATAVARLAAGPDAACGEEEEGLIQQHEGAYPEECAALRDQITRQIFADVGMRRISEQTLRIMAHAQYRYLLLQQIGERAANPGSGGGAGGGATRLDTGSANSGSGLGESRLGRD